LAEEHTLNAYYWENIYTIKTLIEASGYKVDIAIPKEIEAPWEVKSINGHELTVYGAIRNKDKILVNGIEPSIIINNNDFSSDYSSWIEGLNIKMNPHYKMGWSWRRKETFFKNYNRLVGEFANIIQIPEEYVQVRTVAFKNFDINSEDSRKELSLQVDELIEKLKESYSQHNIKTNPFVFVKNSSGTYGLGVTKVNSGADVLGWNYNSRKKMKAAKGGGGFNEVIIQEGIPTKYVDETGTAEPAIYMVGDKLCGGFLRTHSAKGADENLNSPGAVFKRLCVSDLKIDTTKCPLENVYGWAAKIGMLAIAEEFKTAGLDF
jgi:glutamate--cysteine ligase